MVNKGSCNDKTML